MPERVVVFLDWQNVHGCAREAFGGSGQVDPLRLSELLVARGSGRVLHQVRIYRGLPDRTRDPVGYAANRRQAAAWLASDPHRIRVHLRPLQYRPGGRPREKGIDVMLAVEFVVMAVRGEYDVGILMTSDSDLRPALDIVHDLEGPTPEVAMWSVGRERPLTASRPRRVFCHRLDKAAYRSVYTPVDYRQKKAPPCGSVDPDGGEQ